MAGERKSYRLPTAVVDRMKAIARALSDKEGAKVTETDVVCRGVKALEDQMAEAEKQSRNST